MIYWHGLDQGLRTSIRNETLDLRAVEDTPKTAEKSSAGTSGLRGPTAVSMFIYLTFK